MSRCEPRNNQPPVEGRSAKAVDEHDGLPGALLDVVYPAIPPRPEVVPVRFERQNLQPCTHDRRNGVSDDAESRQNLRTAQLRLESALLSRYLEQSRWRRLKKLPWSRRRRAQSRPWSPAPSSASSRTCPLPMAPAARISQYNCLELECHGPGRDEGAHRSGRPAGNPRRGSGRSRPSGGRPRTRRTSGRQSFWRAAETLEQRTGPGGRE